MELILLAVACGIITALIARARDRRQPLLFWWIYGAALFIVALPHALLFRPDSEGLRRFQGRLAPSLVRCSHCAEMIRPEAKVCRFCTRDVVMRAPLVPAPPVVAPKPRRDPDEEPGKTWDITRR